MPDTTTRATPGSKIKKALGMGMSLELAEKIFSAANVVLIVALIFGVLSTYAIVVSSNVKEAHLKRDIAESNARQKEAELQLLQLRFPRSLDIEKFEAAVKKMPLPTSFEVLYDANAPDASFLSSLIWGVLFNAKWPTQQTMGAVPLKAPPPNNLLYVNQPWTVAAGGGPWGLSVVAHDRVDIDGKDAAALLVKALMEAVKGPPSQTTLGYQTSKPVPAGAVRIIVGPKTP